MFEEEFDVFNRKILLDVGKAIRETLIKRAANEGMVAISNRIDDKINAVPAIDTLKNLLTSPVNGVAKWVGKENKSVVSEEIDNGYDVTAVAFRPVSISFELKCNDMVAIDMFIVAANELFKATRLTISSDNRWQTYEVSGVVTTLVESSAESGLVARVVIEGFISTVNRQFRRNAAENIFLVGG